MQRGRDRSPIPAPLFAPEVSTSCWLFEDKHGCSLVDMPDVLFAVGTEAYGRDVGEQSAVFARQLLLLQFQRSQDTVEIDHPGYAAQLILRLCQGLLGIFDDISRF